MAFLTDRRLRIILVASLALNLMFVGIGAGFFGSGHHKNLRSDRMDTSNASNAGLRGPRSDRGGGSIVGALLPQLDREKRREMGGKIRQAHDANGLTRDQQRDLRRAVIEQLAADPFDRSKMEQALRNVQGFATSRFDVALPVILDHIESMSPQERLAVMERMTRRDKRVRERR